MDLDDTIAKELYFLIFKYLDSGPCKNAAEIIKEEIQKHNLLPPRIDWLGNEHPADFDTFQSRNNHINHDFLLNLVSRVGTLLNQHIPSSVKSVNSLLGFGSQSLLRTSSDIKHYNESHFLFARHHNAPLKPSKKTHHSQNIVNLFNSRQACGPASLTSTLPSHFYEKFIRCKRLLGHLACVYCVSFDRTGRFIFTGADDMLIKIWSAEDSRLLATLRGHAAEITDITVNYENTLLAAGSCDKMIRVWRLKTTEQICILNGHTSQITSLKFCPYSKTNERYLVSTSNDGCVYFWKWNSETLAFIPFPTVFTERSKQTAHLICSSFSAGGSFLAIGSSDHYVRVYQIHNGHNQPPTKVLEIQPHLDQVDSIQFSNSGLRFVSGSKDGTANIWKYECQNWHNQTLHVSETLSNHDLNQSSQNLINIKLKVTMVGWSLDDRYVITAVNDHSIKIWESNTGKLKYIFKEHTDEVFVIETHPVDRRIFLSGGHDGNIVIWDLESGEMIKKFHNQIQGQGYGSIFDCKWSPDGSRFACTDSHGHLSIFGFGDDLKYKIVPDEVFFHTDYRPLIRDAQHYVLDEQMQLAPHLMPPPFLVDIDGNPYPPRLQRLVPGREHCREDQLVPYIAIQHERGVAEILDPRENNQQNDNLNNSLDNNNGLDNQQRARTIDDMIERLAQEQASRRVNEEHGYAANDVSFSNNNQQQRILPAAEASFSNSSSRPGVRRSGDVEGVRQSIGNWQSRGGILNALRGRTYVPKLPIDELKCTLRKLFKFSELEENIYLKESKKNPLPTVTALKELSNKERLTRRKKQIMIQRRGIRGPRNPNRTSTSRLNLSVNNEEDPSIQSDDSDDTSFSIGAAESWQESSSTSENSDDSSDDDWQFSRSDPRSNRTKRKQKSTRQAVDSEDDQQPVARSSARTLRELNHQNSNHNLEDEQPSTSGLNKKSTRRLTKAKKEEEEHLRNIQEPIKFPEWLIELTPKRSPYLPQLNDELIYIKKGHQLYVDAIRKDKLYNVPPKTHPASNNKLKFQQLVKVREINYEIRPPTIVVLKLEVLDSETMEGTKEFLTVKYHDMQGVIDFLILKQFYDNAIQREWKPNDRFKSIIDNKWWFGTVKEVLSNESDKDDDLDLFQKIKVIWDSKDEELMSAWDLEPIGDSLSEFNITEPSSSSFNESNREGLSITEEDRQRLMYQPNPNDWPECGRDLECERLIRGLEKIMQTSWAEYFIVPVDLNEYPDYADLIAYPIDLTTIKSRLENKFYRSLDAVKFDVSYIQKNAKIFNLAHSMITKNAKILNYLCIQFIDRHDLQDPAIIAQEIQQNKDVFDETETDTEAEAEDERIVTRRGRPKKNEPSWLTASKALLNELFRNVDSEPFRNPVDLNEYEDYLEKVSTPMDLSTVKEQLYSNCYPDPKELDRDLKLIFTNSKLYNTDKRSVIYTMTLRLQSLVIEKMKDIKNSYKQDQIDLQNKKKSNKKSKLLNGTSNIKTRKSERHLEPQPSTSRQMLHNLTNHAAINQTNNHNRQQANNNARGRRRQPLKTINEQEDDQMSVDTVLSEDRNEEVYSDDDYCPSNYINHKTNRKVTFNNKSNSEEQTVRRTGRQRKPVTRMSSDTDIGEEEEEEESREFNVSVDEETELEDQTDEQSGESDDFTDDSFEENSNKRKFNRQLINGNGRKSIKRKNTRRGRKSKKMKLTNGHRARKASLTTESEQNNSHSLTEDESATDIETSTINNSGSSSGTAGRRRGRSSNKKSSGLDRYGSRRTRQKKINYKEDNGSDFEYEHSASVSANPISSRGRVVKLKGSRSR